MFKQIKAAKKRLTGHVNKTPILTSRTINDLVGAQVFFKCENYQRIGAFKYRGAFNCISQLSEQQMQRGIIAFSSGNHAQAVALVGKMLDIETTIVMPVNAPKIKIAATKGYGAKVVLFDPETEIREQVTANIQDKNGYTLVPPFDHLDVISGQGTVALELLEKIPNLDTLLVPCGGGGLLSGSAIAAKGINPKCQVIGIEPEMADDAFKSFYSNKLVSKPNPQTIADGTRTSSLGTLTFPLIQTYVDEMVTVSELAIIDAVKFHLLRMKIVVEPSGALGLAALMSKQIKPRGKVGIIITGGNIDPATLVKILQEDK